MANSLFEQYRPITWSDVVGQDDAMRTIANWRKRGITGRAVMVTGNSGCGKTTIARLLARETCDDTAIREIDAADLTEANVKDAIRCLRTRGMFGEKEGRALIVNECHRLKKSVRGSFLTLLEDDLPNHVLILFTTTSDNFEKFFDDGDDLDAKPFLSRCNKLPLARRGIAEPFAKRAAEIAIAEGLAADGATLETVFPRCLRLAKDHGNNLREMLTRIEDGYLLAN